MSKVFTIASTSNRTGNTHNLTGTIVELVTKCAYTLECGASYQHERGNVKVNRTPKTIKSLLTNLNNAVNNSAANGCASTSYSLVN